jgi:hypothetical protein
MIPVVMLVINLGELSYLIMTCPSLEHIPVIYLMIVVLDVIESLGRGEARIDNLLNSISNAIELAYMSFSLLINISATSIIALKAW